MPMPMPIPVHPSCPLCRASVRADRLDNHLINIHLLGRPELLQEVLKALSKIDGDLLTCGFCRQQIKKGRLAGHFLRAHKPLFPDAAAEKLQQPASAIQDTLNGKVTLDQKLFSSLVNEKRLVATRVERCECRQVVSFVEIKPGTLKSFDVDAESRLIGPHVCDGKRSESIYAFSGGAIDSNRRKH